MFGEVFRFEVRYQLARKTTWICFLLVNLPILVFSTGPFFNAARANGYAYNSPFALASAAIFGGVLGMLLSAAVAGDAASRDVSLRLSPLLYTTPISRAAYLGGRFLAAFVVVALLLASIPIGQYLMLWILPGLDPALIAPFDPVRYLLSYGVMMVPTAFATSALMFAAAALARRATAAFAVVAGLFVSAIFTNAVLAQTKNLWALAGQLDPFAMTLMTEISRQRTPAQKGNLLIGLEPAMLANRAIWIALGCLVLLGAFARFRFSQGATAGLSWRWRRRPVADPLDAPSALASRAQVAMPAARLRFDTGARLRQALAIAGQSFREIVFSRGFLAVVAVALVVAITGPQLMQHQGVPLVPVTGWIAGTLGSATDFFGFVAPLLSVFFAGQLVWREREARLAAIADAAPLADWVPLAGKALGLGLALAAWQGLLMAAGMVTQLQMGYTALDPLLWLQMLFGLGLSGHLLFAVLAIALHVVANQKVIGNFAGLLAFGFMLFADQLGIEHHLLVYASDPGWSYSDLRGFGGTVGPVLWFRLYWAGWALLLVLAARLLWPRGAELSLRQRWAAAPVRLSPTVGATAAVALAGVASAGGWIFYNTNVRNAFVGADARLAAQADYERRYAASLALPQPVVAARRLQVELYPERATAQIRGRDVYVNRSRGPISELHVETASSVDTGRLVFDRPATLVSDDIAQHHRVVRLATPLAPGEALAMGYTLHFGGHGFSNRGLDTAVTRGATYFDHEWLPVLGYQRGREIDDDATRRAFGLPARPEVPPPTDATARGDIRGAERVHIETTIGTAADQVAVGPGQLQRRWTRGGRSYFAYATAAPMRNEFGIYSARYAVREERAGDTMLRAYYHPGHAANLDRMLAGARASLQRFSRVYGPYPAPQMTLVEVPGMDIGLHAYPTNVRYYEGYALLNPAADPRGVDFAFAVMAHELAHQWWGNQVTPAAVAGGGFVSESLAWYSAFGAVAEAKGEAHLQRLLEMLRDDYLGPHARDGVPLLEAVDRFTAYRTGPLSLVALRDAIGEAGVDQGLRSFLRKYGSGALPRANSLDLYAELQAVTPPAQRELLDDLLARNTFWDLRTRSASARRVGHAWQVTLAIAAAKESVDREGRISPRPIGEPIEVAVYGPADGDRLGKLLYLARHRLQRGEQQLTVTVPSRPATAGIDPRHLMIDLERRNNVATVQSAP